MKKVNFYLSSMNIGGTEKSFLSLLDQFNEGEVDITVKLLEKKGGFLNSIPSWVKVEEVEWYKRLKPFVLESPYYVVKMLSQEKDFLHLIQFIIVYYITKYTKNRYFYYSTLFRMHKITNDSCDIAISYQGPTDVLDFYVTQKTNADRKVCWMHFDISKWGMNRKLYTRLYGKADEVYAVSKGAVEALKVYIPQAENKIELIYNIVSKKMVNNMKTGNLDLKLLDNDLIKIVTVGRISKEKGIELALDAMNILKNKKLNVKWFWVGSGVGREEIVKKIHEMKLEEYFILTGETLNPYPYMDMADIYVQPSLHEGYCLTLAEAIILNKPIVTTDFTGAREQIIPDVTGIITDTDAKAIATKIESLVTQPSLQNKLIVNSKKTEIVNENDQRERFIKSLKELDSKKGVDLKWQNR